MLCPDIEGLRKRSRYPEMLRAYLGTALADWLLPGSELAALPDAPGSVVLLFRNGGGNSHEAPPIPGLGEGILLPVEWRRGEHSGWLPEGILEVANKVRRLMGEPASGYGLYPSKVLGEANLSRLDFRGDSIFVPLAAALQVMISGGKGKPLVFATGAWDDNRERISSVQGHEQKVGAIRHFLGKQTGDATLFVPDDDLDEAKKHADNRIKVRALAVSGHRDPKISPWNHLLRQISPLLAEYETPPDRTANLDLRIQYVNRADVKERRVDRFKYQTENLAEDLGKDAKFVGFHREIFQGAPLAMSFNPGNLSLASILFHAVKPARLLLLSFGNKEDEKALEFAQGLGVSGEHLTLISVVPGQEEEAINEVVRFLEWHATPEKYRLVECTNGLSVLKVVMTLAAARTGALILNLDLNEGTSFHVQRHPPIQVYTWAKQAAGRCS